MKNFYSKTFDLFLYMLNPSDSWLYHTELWNTLFIQTYVHIYIEKFMLYILTVERTKKEKENQKKKEKESELLGRREKSTRYFFVLQSCFNRIVHKKLDNQN